MELTFNGKTFKFVFGFGFLKEINNGAKVEANGIQMNMGIATLVVALQMSDVEVLLSTLKKANLTVLPRVSNEDLEHIFDDLEAEDVFNVVLDELKKSQFTKTAVNQILEEAKEKEAEKAKEEAKNA